MSDATEREELVEQVRAEKHHDPLGDKKRANKYITKALKAVNKTLEKDFTVTENEDGTAGFTRNVNSISGVNSTEEAVDAYRRLGRKVPELNRHESGILDVLYTLQEKAAVQKRSEPIVISAVRYKLFTLDLAELRAEAAETVVEEPVAAPEQPAAEAAPAAS